MGFPLRLTLRRFDLADLALTIGQWVELGATGPGFMAGTGNFA